ncbi:hypothetical protein B0T25DRAFT_263299 [Lasiosphaeria hispida]|uniref:Uncharacterized protein n=1 Tax=Lasiosphaeria hispida TaxID=260671 RepID=A0AAJ0MD55_9PEZI|nr:hypothetical protein B0T25DRAFT_263299 [Lasiosphaeria hispida]
MGLKMGLKMAQRRVNSMVRLGHPSRHPARSGASCGKRYIRKGAERGGVHIWAAAVSEGVACLSNWPPRSLCPRNWGQDLPKVPIIKTVSQFPPSRPESFPWTSPPFSCQFVDESTGMPIAGTQTNCALQEIPMEDVDPERLAITLQRLFGKVSEVYMRHRVYCVRAPRPLSPDELGECKTLKTRAAVDPPFVVVGRSRLGGWAARLRGVQ